VPPSAVVPPLVPDPAPRLETAPLPDLPKIPEKEATPPPDLPKVPEQKVTLPPDLPKVPEEKVAPPSDLAKPPEHQVAPLPIPELRPPVTRTEEQKAEKPPKPAAKPPAKPVRPNQAAISSRPPLPITPSLDTRQQIDEVRRWQLAVIERLQPFMRWPDDAPYWISQAAPEVAITIDRKGNVLGARVIRTSGFDSFDKAARRIFKRALVLPPPPPQMPGNPLMFTMAVTFTQ
jgi:protein TonB